MYIYFIGQATYCGRQVFVVVVAVVVVIVGVVVIAVPYVCECECARSCRLFSFIIIGTHNVANILAKIYLYTNF